MLLLLLLFCISETPILITSASTSSNQLLPGGFTCMYTAMFWFSVYECVYIYHNWQSGMIDIPASD